MILASLLNIIFIGIVKPFEQHHLNKLEIFNELCILASFYHLMLFTPYINNPVLKYSIGWSIITVITFNIGINMLLIIVDALKILKLFILKLKHKCYLKMQKHAKYTETQSPELTRIDSTSMD